MKLNKQQIANMTAAVAKTFGPGVPHSFTGIIWHAGERGSLGPDWMDFHTGVGVIARLCQEPKRKAEFEALVKKFLASE